MVATMWKSVEHEDPSYREIDPSAKIADTARIEPFCVIDEHVEIGENTIIGPFNHIRSGTKIGNNCKIGGHGTFEGRCSIGNYVRIGTHCNIGWNCEIDDYVFIGGQFTGGNDKHMLWHRVDIFPIDGYKILRGARIGLGVVLLPGIIIGEEAMIGAGSLVTHSVPSLEIWYGHPAMKRGMVPNSEKLRVNNSTNL